MLAYEQLTGIDLSELTTREVSLHLPSPSVWQHDPARDGLLPTPLDERGLVDLNRLIQQMKQTVTPDYTWESSFSDVHHLQWPNRWYAHGDDSATSPHAFRELAIGKALVPRVFHNWVHRITEPPPVPTVEVMRYRIEAQRVALALFKTVQQTKRLVRRRHWGEEELETLLMQRFDDFADTFEHGKSLPKPFQLVDFDGYQLKSAEDMVAISRDLGKRAVIATPTRLIRSPLAA